MQLSTTALKDTRNPIPVIGIESEPALFNEPEPTLLNEEREDREDNFSRISLCAYYKAEARGFEPGHEMEDWLAAEAEED